MTLHRTLAPSDWVQRHSLTIPQSGPVLDLACGSGRHARFLIQRGYAVIALDNDASALSGLQQDGVTTLLHDLEQGQGLPFADASFAGIVVCNYLHRPLFPELQRCLQPGGVLIYETFMQGQQEFGRPRSPAFLLQTDELLQFTKQYHFDVLAFEQGLSGKTQAQPSMRQALCAIRRVNHSL